MIAKRGVELESIHFFSYPYTSERAKDKTLRLAEIISAYTGDMRVTVVPFTELQEALRDRCPEDYFTLLMRRSMFRISETLARRSGCGALITGESLGQVASQTMEALAVTGEASNLPVLRPLIGLDKEEIVTISRKIGALSTSILPYEDCCTVFTPKHPKTKPALAVVLEIEAAAALSEIEARATEGAEEILIKRGNVV
jgi:thiamine biosynthesis protein ThiI